MYYCIGIFADSNEPSRGTIQVTSHYTLAYMYEILYNIILLPDNACGNCEHRVRTLIVSVNA